MKKNTSDTIKKAQSIPFMIIGEGLLVGAAGGLIVVLYRVALTCAAKWLDMILKYARGNPVRIAVWFLALILMANIVGKLMKWEPMISGSGITQIEAALSGRDTGNWKKVIPAKLFGGFLCLLGGLSLGMGGPSIQLGAMTGQGVSRLMHRGKKEERRLMTCGAGVGLAAVFHAPLAGMMFALEGIHKGFSVSILASVMTASVTADYISSYILGTDPILQISLVKAIPQSYYWLLVLLGIILGILGTFYSRVMQKAQDIYKKMKLTGTRKLMLVFLTAGVLGFTMPSVLGSGHDIILSLTDGQMILKLVIVTFVVKFLFSAISFGSGAPGGIFFPLMTLGALTGCIFGMLGVRFFGLEQVYMNNFILLSMTGFLSVIVRAPITGMLLVFEMSGSVSQMLSLAVVSAAAYITAAVMKSGPIYEV